MRPFVQMNNYNEDKVAIINFDDPNAIEFLNATNGRILTYGLNDNSDLHAKNIKYEINQTTFDVYCKSEHKVRMTVPLFGKYNIYNVLSVLGYFYTIGYDIEFISTLLQRIPTIEGRFEHYSSKDGVTVVIDYAHNPDAIYQVLSSLKVIAKKQIFTVIGAGGNRDRSKRKEMGKIVTKYSDHVFFTSDNPRFEDPLSIIYDLISGTDHCNYTILVDRKKAIEK